MGVNYVNLLNGETLVDLRNDTVTPETLAEGETAHNAAGEQIVGRMPPGSGEAIREIFYADFDIDLSTFTITGASATYQEIVSQIQAGKYVVGIGTYAMVASPINKGYFPLSAYVPEENLLLFSGFIQSAVSNQLVVLSITVEVYSNNTNKVRARIVSTTDIN